MKLCASDFPEVPFQLMHNVHLEEVEMINAIYDLIVEIEAGANKSPVLTEKLDGLLTHTKEHFANEERLMQEAHFPPYAMHKGAHDLFLSEFEAALADWRESQTVGPIAMFLRLKLPRWMKDHIGSMDYVTAGFLAMHAK
ncbi:hemerythrin [Mariprofundus aestuarium]|uniref:Hemerythrin n=1 Tax=Mariprofundus aestuarium TaxID=1921086 RepID=A0A2K8L468_MARES|nr:hemerythrin family protein [Mariprofundus aestuarium]ATX80631.1 hemerythrin [Mariprofundus aestuarium]